MGMGAVDKDMQ